MILIINLSQSYGRNGVWLGRTINLATELNMKDQDVQIVTFLTMIGTDVYRVLQCLNGHLKQALLKYSQSHLVLINVVC